MSRDVFPDVWSEEEEEEEESSDVKAVVPITIQASGIPRAFEATMSEKHGCMDA